MNREDPKGSEIAAPGFERGTRERPFQGFVAEPMQALVFGLLNHFGIAAPARRQYWTGADSQPGLTARSLR